MSRHSEATLIKCNSSLKDTKHRSLAFWAYGHFLLKLKQINKVSFVVFFILHYYSLGAGFWLSVKNSRIISTWLFHFTSISQIKNIISNITAARKHSSAEGCETSINRWPVGSIAWLRPWAHIKQRIKTTATLNSFTGHRAPEDTLFSFCLHKGDCPFTNPAGHKRFLGKGSDCRTLVWSDGQHTRTLIMGSGPFGDLSWLCI